MAHAPTTSPPIAAISACGMPPCTPTDRVVKAELEWVAVELGIAPLPLPLRDVEATKEVTLAALLTLNTLSTLAVLTALTLLTLPLLNCTLTLLGNRLAVGLGAGALLSAFVSAG